MPTGYTAMIEEDGNTNAREFIKKCSRAFGMFVHQREDSLDADLRYPEPSSYYKRQLDDAWIDLAAAEDWTPEEIAERHQKYVDDIIAENYRSTRRALKINGNYEAVLAKLAKWNPSDPINQNVKNYAIDQINMCYPVKAYVSAPETSQAEWYASHIAHIKDNIEYYNKQRDEEEERLAERRTAIDNFLADLENVPE